MNDKPEMTLRDWFAGQALAQAMGAIIYDGEDAHMFAKCAYEMADAMMAARGES